MIPSRAKAINTRLRRLSEAFSHENGRAPTVDELNALYSAELASQQKKSRKSYVDNGARGGFRALTKEKRLEIARKGAEARWNGKGQN